MRTYAFPLMAVLAFAIAVSTFAAEKPRPAQGNQTQPKKVWTNDDMDKLRAQGLISIVGPDLAAQPATSPAPSEISSPGPTFPIYNSRLDDPEWYAEKASALQAELDKRQAALQAEHNAIAQVADRITQPGIALDQPSIGVTPQSALAILEAQVEEVQTQLDDLSDLARQNGIPPGVLRG